MSYNPLFLFYALTEYPITLLALLMMVLILVVSPLRYKKWSKSNKQTLSNKEFLGFTLSMYVIAFLMFFFSSNATVMLFFFAVFKIACIAYLLLWIIAFFTSVDTYCCCILTMLSFVLIPPLTRSFVPVSIALIITGLVLSIYLVCQKTSYKKILISMIVSIVAVGINMMM